MKKLLYSLFSILLLTNISVSQTTPLMADGNYRIMMNDYTNNINTILQSECPEGLTIDQFKKKVVTGDLTLSSFAQTSITTYALPLKIYGQKFIAANPSLQSLNDSYTYFFASFVPSTRIDNKYYPGNLLESDATDSLKAIDMWNCAMQSFNVENCATQTVVQDTKNLNKLANYCVTKLTQISGVVGVEIMLSGFSGCVAGDKIFIVQHLKYNDLVKNKVLFHQIESLSGSTLDSLSNKVAINSYGFSIDISDYTFIEKGNENSYTFAILNPNNTSLKNIVFSTKNNIDFNQYYIEYPGIKDSTTSTLNIGIEDLENTTNKISFSGDCFSLQEIDGAFFYPSDGGEPTFTEGPCFGNHHTDGNPALGYPAGDSICGQSIILLLDAACLHEGGGDDAPADTGTGNSNSNSGSTSGGSNNNGSTTPGGGGGNSSSTTPTNIPHPHHGIIITTPVLATAVNDPNIAPSPCDQLKYLSNNTDVNNAINILKTKVHDNNEFGYEIVTKIDQTSGDSVLTTSDIIIGENFTTIIEYGANVFGAIHNHPENGQAIPSWGDVRWLQKSATSQRYPRNDGYNVSIIVVRNVNNPSSPPNIYSLTIDNTSHLSNEVNAVWTSSTYASIADTGERTQEINKYYGQKYADVQNSPEGMEVRFLGLFNNYGISLNKYNNSTNKWEKLTLHNPYNPNNPNEYNYTDKTPCN